MTVVDAILVSICEHTPIYTGNNTIAEKLFDPLAIAQRHAERFGLHEKHRPAVKFQCVVHRII